LAHGRDHHTHAGTRARGQDHPLGHALEPRHVGDRAAAVFLHDNVHRNLWGTSVPQTPSGFPRLLRYTPPGRTPPPWLDPPACNALWQPPCCPSFWAAAPPAGFPAPPKKRRRCLPSPPTMSSVMPARSTPRSPLLPAAARNGARPF